MNMKLFLCTALAVVFLLTLAACGVPSSSSAPFPEAPSLPTVASYVAIPKSQSSPPSSASEVELPFDAPERWQEPLPVGLTRGWYAGIAVGSGYAERYLFLEDGTFYFNVAGNDSANRQPYMDGEWAYTEGVVHLTVKRKVVIEGGEVVTGQEALPFAEDIVGGEYVQVELSEDSYETLDLPLEIVPVDAELEETNGITGSIMLGDLQFYAKGGVDYQEMLTYWDMYGSL